EIPSARLPSSIFFSTFTSGTDPPPVRHQSTSGPPRLHPFPPFPVFLLPQISNPLPDCPPPFFFSTFTSGTNPPPVRHRSIFGPPRLHPFPELEHMNFRRKKVKLAHLKDHYLI
ncbi:hypothetical protein ERO13_D06G117332v2, partial [Gossypium hirsutum]